MNRMCSKDQLFEILDRIGATASGVFGDKLKYIYLYGSYARGDQTSESDIDIMVIADVDTNDLFRYKMPFLTETSELGLEHDVVITVTLKDFETFHRFADVLPFYQNIIKEGVCIAG